MSRSGYSDDCDFMGLYRASVDRAVYGKRGQAFLRELAAALDAMPDKVLIAGDLVRESGECCAIGAVCKARSLDVSGVDSFAPERVAAAVGIARCLAAEIEFENDERNYAETPAERWKRMRDWVEVHILREPSTINSQPSTT